MADFFPLHPQINVRLDLRTVIPDFSGETAHIVVCIGEMSDRSLVTTKVGETRRVSVASPDYLATHGTPTTMADLQSHSCLVLDEPGANGRWTFVDGASAQISPRLIVSNADAAIDAAIAGAGIVRAHCYEVRRAEEAGELVRVLEHFEAPATPIQIVHRDAGLVPAKVRAFVEFAAPRLKARLGIGLQLVSP